jgi:hypothetical protein
MTQKKCKETLRHARPTDIKEKANQQKSADTKVKNSSILENYRAILRAHPNIFKDHVKACTEALERGDTKPLTELLKLTIEKDATEIKGGMEIQKIFVTPDDLKNADKMIDDTINE